MKLLVATCAAAFVLSACGGGGGGGTGGSIPSTTPTPTSTSNPNAPGTLTVSVAGSSTTINARKRPHFIPPSMTQLFVSVTQLVSNSTLTQVIPCTPSSGCSVSFSENPGTYNVSLVAQDNLQQSLAQAGVQEYINANQTTAVKTTLDGVVQYVSVAPKQPLVLSGSAQATTLLVTAYDADKDVIMSPGSYTSAIQLSVKTTNSLVPSAMTLSQTTINAPTDTVTLSYDGESFQSLTVIANFPDEATGSAQYGYVIAPRLSATQYAIPSGNYTTGSLVVGSDGNVWTATHLSVAKISTSGSISEYCANPGALGVVNGPDGEIWFSNTPMYAANPFITPPCGSSPYGLYEVSSSGVQAEITPPPLTSGTNVPLPLIGPDGTAWTSTSAGEININAAKSIVQTQVLSLNGSQLGNPNAIAPDGSFWYASQPGFFKCTSGVCQATATVPSPFLYPQWISPGPNGTMLVQDVQDIYDVNLNGNTLWNTNHPWNTFFESPAVVVSGGLWAGALTSQAGVPELLYVNPDGTDFAYVQLPALPQAQEVNGSYPNVSSVLLGPDGRLWCAIGSSVYAAPIP